MDGAPARTVLDGIDLRLEPGRTIALTGRSGAGKTTLLYLAAGLLRPTSGRVLFDGRPLGEIPADELALVRRRRIGLVFQNNLSLSALPVWENAALPLLLEGQTAAKSKAASIEMLERLGLADYADRPTTVLSGGQRRRLGLARCILGRPDLLLADEPTADLDEVTAADIERFMFEWLTANGHSAIIVTHFESIERAADQVLRLENGMLAPNSKSPSR
ncbi:ATP-binding cassette domain-containing protein [bacterium]|nr:ATP-binding cassette domain-containing protein [bacterium]